MTKNEEGIAFGFWSIQIWDDPEGDPRKKGFSLETSEGLHHYIAAREQLTSGGKQPRQGRTCRDLREGPLRPPSGRATLPQRRAPAVTAVAPCTGTVCS
jgi:hypothetical protein